MIHYIKSNLDSAILATKIHYTNSACAFDIFKVDCNTVPPLLQFEPCFIIHYRVTNHNTEATRVSKEYSPS